MRDTATGRGSRDTALYREVVERVRSSDVDAVLNLTAGMGGDLVLGGDDAPLPVDEAGTDMVGAAERLAHNLYLSRGWRRTRSWSSGR